MRSELINISDIAGVPLHYDRLNNHRCSYGTMGKKRSFQGRRELMVALNAWITEVCKHWHGKPTVVCTAGLFVEKPGWHGKGLAFDLDAIFWEDRHFITLQMMADPRFYYGIAASLRMFFPTVLSYLYDSNHRDHFHAQLDGQSMGFRAKSKSDAIILQGCLRYCCGENTAVDGIVGKKTIAALKRVIGEDDANNISEMATYRRILSDLTEVGLQ